MREWREHVVTVLATIDGETWRALVAELRLPLEQMLEKNLAEVTMVVCGRLRSGDENARARARVNQPSRAEFIRS